MIFHASSAHNNLGTVYTGLGQHERAAALIREELQLDQDASGVYGNLAIEYMVLNRLDEAKATLDQALARKLDVFVGRSDLHRDGVSRRRDAEAPYRCA